MCVRPRHQSSELFRTVKHVKTSNEKVCILIKAHGTEIPFGHGIPPAVLSILIDKKSHLSVISGGGAVKPVISWSRCLIKIGVHHVKTADLRMLRKSSVSDFFFCECFAQDKPSSPKSESHLSLITLPHSRDQISL